MRKQRSLYFYFALLCVEKPSCAHCLFSSSEQWYTFTIAFNNEMKSSLLCQGRNKLALICYLSNLLATK